MTNMEERRRKPFCSRCRNHFIRQPLKGHKRYCPYKCCRCSLCELVAGRQRFVAAAMAVRRQQAEEGILYDPGDQVSPGSTSSQSGPSSRDRSHSVSLNHSSGKYGTVSSGSSSNHGNPRPSGSVSGSQSSSTLNSVSVVTIAPTPSHRPYLGTGVRKNLDKMTALPSMLHDRLPDDDDDVHRITPHSSMGAISTTNHEDVTRGFKQYHPGEDLSNRHQMAAPEYQSHFQNSKMDPMYSAAMQVYHNMMQPHPYATHPAYRTEDPLLLERYRILQQGQMYSYSPGMVAASAAAVHPYLTAMGAAGYPSEIITQQHMSYLASMSGTAPAVKPSDHVFSSSASDRPKSTEEQRRKRDKDCEKEREREEHHEQD